jgi:methyl-accepting chemotaxis protein
MFSERQDITSEEKKILESIKEIEAKTLPMIKKVIELRRAGDLDQAKQIMLSDARPVWQSG